MLFVLTFLTVLLSIVRSTWLHNRSDMLLRILIMAKKNKIRKLKGMTVTGGGPNGPKGLSNSVTQDVGTRLLLQKARELKARINVDKARQVAEDTGPSISELRRAKKIQKF